MANTIDYSFLNPTTSLQTSLTTQLLDSLNDSSGDTDFQGLMEMMVPLMAMQTMSSSSMFSGSESGSNFLGIDFSSMMMPIMMQLMEQLLEQQVNSTQASAENAGAVDVQSVEDAEGIQINQFEAELEVGGDGANANCGPTSLAMCLHSLGLTVSGEIDGMSDGQVVDMARISMVSDSARDGVTESGQRSEAEHSTWTNFSDLTRGAKAGGATTEKIIASASSIQQALESGAKVIISGTFSGKSPLPWTGDRGSDNSTAPGYATNHIVLVSGYDEKTGMFIVNDPARKSPLAVSAETLNYFMQGNAGALALSTD